MSNPSLTRSDRPQGAGLFALGLAVIFLFVLVVVPLMAVLGMAFAKGIDPFLKAIQDPDTLSAIRLTLLTTAIAVPLNAIFGVTAAWAKRP